MRELTPEVQEQLKAIAAASCGDVPAIVIEQYYNILVDSWTKGEISFGLVGE